MLIYVCLASGLRCGLLIFFFCLWGFSWLVILLLILRRGEDGIIELSSIPEQLGLSYMVQYDFRGFAHEGDCRKSLS